MTTPTDADERLCVISCDSHVGPSMDQLRPYCEPGLLEAFDEFTNAASELEGAPRAGTVQSGEHRRLMLAHSATSGEQDPHRRLADMDADGVAAEVIFHGSQNDVPMPFGFGGRGDRDLEAAGIRIYNRWLADFCSVQPERRRGLMQIPGWDPDASLQEVEFGYAAGLRAVNLPSMRLEDLTWSAYTDPAWEPFWSRCDELGIPLVNHQAADLNVFRDVGPARLALVMADAAWLARRVMWWMMFTGVFERHPGLKLVITEQPGDWPKYELEYLDSVYAAHMLHELRRELTRSPSEIFRSNVYVGGSFLSNHEVHLFIDAGFGDRVMWGSDYPHVEGTWPHSTSSIRSTLFDVDLTDIRRILSGTAIDAYGFSATALDEVAQRIGPRVSDITSNAGSRPKGREYSLGFRVGGAWH